LPRWQDRPMAIKLEEVFKRSGVPTYTFVQPVEFDKLLISLRTPGRGLVVEGPSGIGKTTCVLKVMEHLGIADQVLILSGRKPDDIPLIADLPSMKGIGVVFVDDFHRLPDDIKARTADFMKTLADEERPDSKVVAVGINKAGDSLIKFSADLTGRLDTIHFEANPDDKLQELIARGEEALNISINIKDEIVRESRGSFHIAQMLCHETCLEKKLFEAAPSRKDLHSSIEVIREKVLTDLGTTFFARDKAFATGPKLRRDGRAPYFHLLHWLATEHEWSLQTDDVLTEHRDHRGSVGQIVEKGYLAEHIARHTEIQDVLHFDTSTHVLSVEDPKFVYYIRNLLWSKFCRQVGFPSLDFPSQYDFALSFAGPDRPIAAALFDELTIAYELSVFYDQNEQHRILAENIEDYLGPIYRSEAKFVVALLGPEYPKRIWTKFESDQFKTRFGEHAVVPIWFSDAPPGMFDETVRYGGVTFDRTKDVAPQIQNIAELLYKKLGAARQQESPST
jgi:hypothetical protein